MTSVYAVEVLTEGRLKVYLNSAFVAWPDSASSTKLSLMKLEEKRSRLHGDISLLSFPLQRHSWFVHQCVLT